MASKKTATKKPEATAEVITKEVVKGVETNEETVVEPESSDVKDEATAEVITEKTVEIEELPDNVRRVLKIFSDMPEMYVSKGGGVFPVGTKHSLIGSAILYKNPFYKNPKNSR